ncbi:MAG: hypothetical protein EKK40_12350 [Bradyrhizobiaceae bacterium]|nr:MAG: hypothetical protein EKK40_12350 [Bradyrhizobiaceae bacterium]
MARASACGAGGRACFLACFSVESPIQHDSVTYSFYYGFTDGAAAFSRRFRALILFLQNLNQRLKCLNQRVRGLIQNLRSLIQKLRDPIQSLRGLNQNARWVKDALRFTA